MLIRMRIGILHTTNSMKTHTHLRHFTIPIIIVWISSYQVLGAQTDSLQIDLKTAIELALKNHVSVRNAHLKVTEAQTLTKTSIEPPQSQFTYGRGQINALVNTDNYGSFSQDLPSPLSWMPRKRWLEAQVAWAKAGLYVNKNDLVWQVKTTYLEGMTLKERRKTLLVQDSIYKVFTKAAEIKYKAGDANYLSFVVAKTQAEKLQNDIYQNTVDTEVISYKLQQLLNIERIPSIQESELLKFSLDISSVDAGKNPQLQLLKEELESQKKNTAYEKAKLTPGLTMTYVNQEIEKTAPLQSFQLGVGVPIFYGAQKARISASRIREEMLKNSADYQEFTLKREMEILVKEYKKWEQTLAYYDSVALPQASLIIDNSLKNYKAGEIEYVELARNIQEAYMLRLQYVDILNLYDQTILKIEYLIGNSL
jgi:heavy metal efflux system protein